MALQFAAVLLATLGPGPWHQSTGVAGMVLAVAAIAWLRSALKHLGRQWRVQAVIAEGHELITTGPYRVVRHPVYLAFFGMLCATALLRGRLAMSVAAFTLFAGGTEIRVKAEERLLLAAFGDRFRAFASTTPWAYIPWVR